MPANNLLITTSSFGGKDDAALAALRAEGHEVVLNPFARTLTEAEIGALLAEHRPVGLIAGLEPLTEQVMRGAVAHLKVISRCGTGLDNVDLDAAKRLGIAVLNTPAAPAEAVAELSLGLILALIRNIVVHDQLVRSGAWKKRMGLLLSEITVGIVGLGRVGRRVAAILRPLGTKIIATDVLPDHDWIAAHGVSLMSLPQLLATADVVSLHLPYASGDLHRLMNAERIAAMKPGSFLINTSRGALIDEQAVTEALQSGHLAGAAVDTFELEPYTGLLLQAPNVILSPHAGSYARATRNRMELEAAQNLIAGLAKS
ncbi:MAG: phosphoglycerate dehydrogenase [Chthoniobacteraceae bacterium]